MRPLVAVRSATSYDPRFLARSPLFWPLRRAGGWLAELDDFPAPAMLGRVFEGTPLVRFVPPVPRPRRRRRGPLDLEALYDARITREGCVPTRERSWHDLLNALVWGAFPKAKRALHARQHRAIIERVEPGASTLPRTRSREQDALALVDEGGVVILAPDAATAGATAEAVIFGHAIYESLVFGVRPAAVAAIVLPRAPTPRDLVKAADVALAAALDDPSRFRSPAELCRVDLLAQASPK